MFASLRFFRPFPSLLAPSAFAVVLLVCATPASAQLTRLWLLSQMEQFEKGTPVGVAIESDGHLRQGPGLTELLTTPSTFVWSLAVDKSGRVFASTGSPAAVLRLGERQGEKPFTLLETKDVSIQALCFGPDGALYVATVPGGKVYKLNPNAATKVDEASTTVVFDASKLAQTSSGQSKTTSAAALANDHYIWDLTFDSAGRLYIATGNPGAVYRVDVAKPGATPKLFFSSDEAHIRTLAWDGKGNLIAGSDGSGLVYRISPDGKGYVLFEAPRREITALAIDGKGTIFAACVGEKGHNPLPPLPVQGAGAGGVAAVQPESYQAANASASVPEGSAIYALSEGQAPRMLWSGKDEIVYALAARPDGLLAVTGNHGRIFRIQEDGSYADIGHLQAQQGLSMTAAQSSEGIYVGTANTGKVYLLGAAETHEYASDVLDAGTLARFGRVEIEPGSSNYHIFTRSGNVEQPVRGWSDWQPLQDGSVASPAGRFLQWKVVLHEGGVLGSVGMDYLPVNSAPVVDELVVVPGARINPQAQAVGQPQTVNITFSSSGESEADDDSSSSLSAVKDRTAVTVRWAAHDVDGDKLIYSLYLRGDGETQWWLLKKGIKAEAYSFDATQIPDGGYQIKVVASDAPSHSPGEALTGEKISDRFVIDTTPPMISALNATVETAPCGQPPCPLQVRVTFDATDAISPIARAGYSADAGPWQFIAPVGVLSDSRHEHYDFVVPVSALAPLVTEHLITVRAYDRYDNVSVAKSVFHTEAK